MKRNTLVSSSKNGKPNYRDLQVRCDNCKKIRHVNYVWMTRVGCFCDDTDCQDTEAVLERLGFTAPEADFRIFLNILADG